MATNLTTLTLLNETAGMTAGGVSYKREYQVGFVGPFNAALILYGTIPVGTSGANALPKRWDTHPVDAGAFVDQVLVKLADNEGGDGSAGALASYEVTYAQKSINFDPNPLTRPPVITGGGADFTQTVDHDVDGKPILNSAGQLYEGLPERPIRAMTFTIQRNEAGNPATKAGTNSNTTNSDVWYGVAIGNGLMGKITFAKKIEIVNGSPVTYWEVTYPITVRRDGWRVKLIDNGYAYLDGTNRATILDKGGNTPRVPALLDGAGGVLPPGNTTGVVFPSDGYKIDDETSWGTLSLPNPFS